MVSLRRLDCEPRLRHFVPPPLTSPPPRPPPGSHLLYAERRFAPHRLTYRHIETLPRIHRNPASDLLVRRPPLCRKSDDTARAVASDLLYRYGCQAMTADRLERAASSRNYRPQPLCRCESGGALPAASPPPPAGQLQSSFRAAQSLPSTPNAARRPIDLPPPRSLLYSAPPDHPVPPHQSQSAARTFFPDPPAPSAVPPADLSRPEQFLLRDLVPDGQVSQSPPSSPLPHRSRPQPFRRPAPVARHSSQPLAKLSSFVIIVIALVIVGFIVFSPLLHYSIK